MRRDTKARHDDRIEFFGWLFGIFLILGGIVLGVLLMVGLFRLADRYEAVRVGALVLLLAGFAIGIGGSRR